MAEYDQNQEIALWRLGSFGYKADDGDKYYYLKDHIGNIRVTVDEQQNIVTKDDYYPFGLQMPGLTYNNGNPNDRLKYSGKELDQEGGLYKYHFGWRDYNPELGRWFVVDPARQFASPYVAMGNNPVLYIDEDGRIAWFVPILIGAVFNTIMNAEHIDNFGDFAKFAGIGALGGAMSMVGNPAAWCGMQNVLLGATQGGIIGGLNSEAKGGNFGEGFKTGAIWGAAFGLATSEQFGNTLKGEGWNSNEDVFNSFINKGVNKQEILDYFGKDGTYNPDHEVFEIHTTAEATVDLSSGKIVYSDDAFTSFENFEYSSFHEPIHVKQWQDGKYYQGMDPIDGYALEVEAHMANYKNSGLLKLSNSRIKQTIESINQYKFFSSQIYATPLGPRGSFFKKWWHFIYRIPRRFGEF